MGFIHSEPGLVNDQFARCSRYVNDRFGKNILKMKDQLNC